MQLPYAITWSRSTSGSLLPIEVAGWMLKCLNLQGGCWLLVLSRDIGLGVALSQMGPVGTNVTLGLTDVDDQQMDVVTEQAMQVVSGVNLMCHLGRMQWDKTRAWVSMWGDCFAITTRGVVIAKSEGRESIPSTDSYSGTPLSAKPCQPICRTTPR